MKVLCQILKVNSFFDFRVAYRLSGTGVVECLEIIDVGCNLIQLDDLTGLTLIPVFYIRSMPLSIGGSSHETGGVMLPSTSVLCSLGLLNTHEANHLPTAREPLTGRETTGANGVRNPRILLCLTDWKER